MKRFLIYHSIPHDQAAEYGISVASSLFCDNLLSGNIFYSAYSILPPYVSGTLNHNFPNVVYSSVRHSKFCKFAPIMEQMTVFRRIPGNSSVWLYNINPLNCFLFILLRLFKKSVQINSIILDYTPETSIASRFFLKLANSSDGLISLSDSSFFKVKNSCCIPGIVGTDSHSSSEVCSINQEYLLSGCLKNHISSLSVALPVFAHLPNCILHITGFNADEKLIEQYTSKYPNILYHKSLSYAEYCLLLNSSCFVLSLRNPLFPENTCNFPSKIIEALLYNKIVISTIHYNQLSGVNYFVVANDIDSFERDIRIISSKSELELLKYANQSNTVIERFGVQNWSMKMSEIETISSNK